MALAIKKAKKPKGASSEVFAALQKAHGEDVASMGGTYAPVGRLASGIFPLDLAVGGGFPDNRITMLFGPESSGKTSVGLRLLAAVQRRGQKGVLVDREDVYDRAWTRLHGVNVDELIVIKPANGEQVVDACEGFMNADDVGMVLLDSLAAAQPQKWIQADAGTAHVGGNASTVSDLYTKVGAALTHRGWKKNPSLFVVINQIRYKIGVMYGDPETTPGGKQPQFASSMSVRFYGKKIVDKDVSEQMPAKLHVDGVVKKWRVPICSTAFEYDMALMPQGVAKVSDVVDTWKTVGTYLQNFEMLRKGGAGWVVVNPEKNNKLVSDFKTLDQTKEHYNLDKEFQLFCQKLVLDRMTRIAEKP